MEFEEEEYIGEPVGFDTATARMDLIKLMAAHYDGNDNGKKEILLRGENAKAIAETEGEWKLVYDSTNRRNIADFPHDWSLYVGGKEGPIDTHFCTAIMGVLSPGDMIMVSKLFPESEIEPLVRIISDMDPTLAVDMSEWKITKGMERKQEVSSLNPKVPEKSSDIDSMIEDSIEQLKENGFESEFEALDEETLARIDALKLDDMKNALSFFLAKQNPTIMSEKNRKAEVLINDNVRKGNWVVVSHSFDREMNRVYPAGWTLTYRGADICECRDNKTLKILDMNLSGAEANAVASAVSEVRPGLALKSYETDIKRAEMLREKAVSATHGVDLHAVAQAMQNTRKNEFSGHER